MYEFETVYNPDTGNLTTAVYTGSGVHLKKDVTFSLSLLDMNGNLIVSDSDFISNPLADSVCFDILNADGSMAFSGYKSGTTSRSLTLTEIENASIFGSYKKDFGVRTTVSAYDGTKNISEFYFYANIPQINTGVTTIYDGSATLIYTPPVYGADPTEGLVVYQNVQQLDQILVNVQLDNSLNYIEIIKYDIYASTENDIEPFNSLESNPANHPYFLYTQTVKNYEDINTIVIKPIGLEYNTDYYFTVVPYSAFGSGNHLKFGPKVFTGIAERNPQTLLETNLFKINNGTESVDFSLLTGVVTLPSTQSTILDTIPSGSCHTILYTSQIKTGTDSYISSELKLVLNNPQTLLESTITNTGQLIYSVDQIGDNYFLYVSGAPISSSYKIYKTTL